MILVSLILLALTFFTSEKIRDAVKSQIPLQIVSTINAEANKISAIMNTYENIASNICRLNSTKGFLSWIIQRPDDVEMIEQWKKVLIGPLESMLYTPSVSIISLALFVKYFK